MDIFHIETASLSTNRTNVAIIDDGTNDQIPQVSFDGGPEFNLNFFDSPDNSNTGFSDPGSDSSTPPPTQLSLNQGSLQTPIEFRGTTAQQLTIASVSSIQSNGMIVFSVFRRFSLNF